jgi:predicted ATPase/class 3 adenylate cyclase
MTECALLFTDIEGSTSLWESEPEAMRVGLQLHDDIMREAISKNRGTVFSMAGDSFAAWFIAVEEAVLCAVELQAVLVTTQWPTTRPIAARMGIHVGPASDPEHLTGPATNRAARVMSAGHGGQILLSRTAVECLDIGKIGPGVTVVSLGEHQLKGLLGFEHLHQLLAPGLRTDFLPVRSELPASLLPGTGPPLFGRADDLERLGDMAGQLVTIVGPPGVGKTRLALEFAHQRSEGLRRAAFMIRLAPVSSPGLVTATIASGCGLAADAAIAVDALLADFLRDRRVLLILDNCEHLNEEVAVVAEALVSELPELLIIATSRSPLGARGEMVLQLRPLATAGEAVELLVDRARRSGADDIDTWSRSELKTICDRLDGLPLAIELLAPALRTLAPLDVLAGLEDSLALPRQSGSTSDHDHYRSLDAMIAWSYDRLPHRAQVVLLQLSVFASSFAIADAAEICGADNAEATRWVSHLVEVNLLTHEPAKAERHRRFRLLEVVRVFGTIRRDDQAATRPATRPATSRHRQWTHGLLDRFSEDGTEIADVRSEMRAAMTRANPTDRAQLVLAAIPLWLDAGPLDEGRALLESALEQTTSKDQRAHLFEAMGDLDAVGRTTRDARMMWERSLADSQDRTDQARLMAKLASTLPVGEQDTAMTVFTEAIERLGAAPFDRRRGRARIDILIRQLGSAYFAGVSTDEAIDDDMRALAEDFGTAKQRRQLLDHEVAALFRARRFRLTRSELEWARRARAIPPELVSHAEPGALFRSGFVEFIGGEHEVAFSWFEAAAGRALETGSRRTEASALAYAALVLRLRGDERVGEVNSRAQALALACGLHQYNALCQAIHAWELLVDGEPAQALSAAEAAVQLWRDQMATYPFQWAALTVAAAASAELGAFAQAESHMRALTDHRLQALPEQLRAAIDALNTFDGVSQDTARSIHHCLELARHFRLL